MNVSITDPGKLGEAVNRKVLQKPAFNPRSLQKKRAPGSSISSVSFLDTAFPKNIKEHYRQGFLILSEVLFLQWLASQFHHTTVYVLRKDKLFLLTAQCYFLISRCWPTFFEVAAIGLPEKPLSRDVSRATPCSLVAVLK